MKRFQAKMSIKSTADLGRYQSLCGYPESDVLPITYPHVLAGRLHLVLGTHSKFPLPVLGLVHASNDIVQYREIKGDEVLEFTCWLEGYRQIGIGVEIDIHTHVHVSGELVWESVSTIVSRTPPGDGVKRDRPLVPHFTPRKSEGWQLAGNLGRRYASLSNDYNPIHMFALMAKLFGFRSQIAHGMFLLGKVAAQSNIKKLGVISLSVIFQRPVFLPSCPTFNIGECDTGEAFSLTSPNGKMQIHGRIGVGNGGD